MAVRFRARSTTPGDPALTAYSLSVVAGYPLVADVELGVKFGTSAQMTGEMIVPDPGSIIEAAGGTYHESATTEVKDGTRFGPSSAYVGSYVGGGHPHYGDRTGGK